MLDSPLPPSSARKAGARFAADCAPAPDPTLRVQLLRAACCVTACVAALPALAALRIVWDTTDYLAHGYFIPVAAAALAYTKRDRLRRALRHAQPPRAGALWVLAAVALECAVVAAQLSSAAALAIAALLGATAHAIAGSALLRPLLPSLGFLLLMAPPPIFMRDHVLIALKEAVVYGSVRLLQAFDYPIAALGSRVLLPQHELFVADACSGLNSLVTLLPVAVIVAHFASRGVWRRAAIVACTLPLAIAGNALRVVVTTVLVHSFGIAYAEGWLHESFGLATVALGTTALLALTRVLR